MKKAFSFLLSLVVVCAALPLTPVTVQAFDAYTQAYDTEYYAPASASFIYQIGLYYSSSSDADAVSHIESAGFTPFGGDFNEGAGGKYVHAGYKTTSDPTKALTALRVWDFTAGGDNPDAPRDSAASAVGGAACTFYRVGSGASEWTPDVMDGDVNLNQGNSGHHLKLYVTTDRNAGLPLAALDTAHNKTAATAYNALLNAGYTVATSFQASLSYQDLNAGAGSGSEYNYLGFKAYAFIAVDSSALRSAYAEAKERYENGGAIYSVLTTPLAAAAEILADLNDGYTSCTQEEIDDAADALQNATPVYTVTLNRGNHPDVHGSDIVFISSNQATIPTKDKAGINEFYTDENGQMGFRLDCENCPPNWTISRALAFSGYNGATEYNTLTRQNTVFTAGWYDYLCSISIASSITLDYDSIDADGFLPIAIEVYDVDFGDIINDPETPQEVVLSLPSDKLVNTDGTDSLSFDVYASDHSGVVTGLTLTPDSANRSYDLALKFDPDAIRKSDAGKYGWIWTIGLESECAVFLPSVIIDLMMEKPETDTNLYSVTVTSEGSGTAYASTASGTVGTEVTLTATPDEGYSLKEWQVVSGGVTLTGNKFNIRHADVEIKAVFVPDVNPTYTLELPELVTVTPGTVFTPAMVNVPELSMVTGVNGKTPAKLRIAFNAGTLTDTTNGDKTIAFYPDINMTYPNTHYSQVLRDFQSAGSQTFYVHILDSAWSTAAPGVYTGRMSYSVFWIYTDRTMSSALESGTIPITVTIPGAPGDVDGDGEVDLGDVTVLSRYLAGGWNVTVDETAADVNKDGKVDLKDVVLIRRFLAGGWNVELK